MLGITDLTYRIGGRILLDGATAALPAGARVGLAGRNGAGKTTLFRIIAGEIAPERGRVDFPPRSRIGRLAQEAPDGPESLLDVVLAADSERAQLIAQAQIERDPHRIAEIQTRLADIGAHAAPARAASILAGLGFSAADQQRPCSEFSGGWRMRVALAATLFAEPDLLVLDQKMIKKQDAQRKHLQAFVDRFRAKASKARQAQSRLKMLAKLQPIASLVLDEVRPIHIPAPDKLLSPPIIATDDVSVGYEPGRPILTDLSLRIDNDDRIALLGANGNGKSTLVKLLAGRLSPEHGTVTRASNLRVAYFAQHQLDELELEASPYDHVRRLMPDAPE